MQKFIWENSEKNILRKFENEEEDFQYASSLSSSIPVNLLKVIAKIA